MLDRRFLQLLAFITLYTVTLGFSDSKPVHAEAGDPKNALALIAADFSDSAHRSVSANLELPAQSKNKGWYANWVMVLGRPNYAMAQNFVQIGLIRRPELNDRLRCFIAYRDARSRSLHATTSLSGFSAFTITKVKPPPIVYREIQCGEKRTVHVVTISQKGNRFRLSIDGTRVSAMPNVYLGANSYSQLGVEVSSFGDTASGSGSDVKVSDKPLNIFTACFLSRGGIRLLTSDSASYSSFGSFRKNTALYSATGHCTH